MPAVTAKKSMQKKEDVKQSYLVIVPDGDIQRVGVTLIIESRRCILIITYQFRIRRVAATKGVTFAATNAFTRFIHGKHKRSLDVSEKHAPFNSACLLQEILGHKVVAAVEWFGRLRVFLSS